MAKKGSPTELADSTKSVSQVRVPVKGWPVRPAKTEVSLTVSTVPSKTYRLTTAWAELASEKKARVATRTTREILRSLPVLPRRASVR